MTTKSNSFFEPVSFLIFDYTAQFTEDGSFIGQYGTARKNRQQQPTPQSPLQAVTGSSSVATFV